MTMHPRSPRLLQACALLAPAVIVQVCAMLLGAGPAPAPAAAAASDRGGGGQGGLDAVLAPPRAPEPSARQQRTLEYLRGRSGAGATIRSPMAHDAVPEPAPTPVSIPSASPESSSELTRLPIPELRLTTILGNRRGGLAAIDGRIRAPGDEIAPGWRLSSIDAAGDRVVITSTDGQTSEVPLRPVRED